MRVGISCYPTHGGSGVVASELGRHLAERGHEIAFISFSSPLRLHARRAGISIHEIQEDIFPFKQYPYTLALASKMVEVARMKSLQIIHAHYAIPFAMAAILARQIAPELDLKVVTTLHGTDITLVGSHSSMKIITAYAINASDAVTAVSNYLRAETYRIFRTEREIDVIYNFVDIDRHAEAASRHAGASRGRAGGAKPKSSAPATVMHISNFRPLKRIGDVIEIFARIQRQIDARLVLVGDGPESMKAEQLVRDLDLTESVEFSGIVDEVEPVLARADLLLLPSESESFGMAALEAMASGVPVVASRIGGIPELVAEGETGYTAPLGHVDEMARLALMILRDPAEHARLSSGARARAAQHFEYRRIVPQYEALYERVLAGR
jgi:N-acetyl-alpha-D-glucosaminyl L-malate synthase BshA